VRGTQIDARRFSHKVKGGGGFFGRIRRGKSSRRGKKKTSEKTPRAGERGGSWRRARERGKRPERGKTLSFNFSTSLGAQKRRESTLEKGTFLSRFSADNGPVKSQGGRI